jgi:PKD repeat protein
MKRLCFIILLLWGSVLPLSAAHIRGGELSYRYIGPGTAPNTSVYELTLKLYIDCGQNDQGQLDTEAFLTVFSKPNHAQFTGKFAPMIRDEFIRYDPNSNPCITNPPRDVCYRLRFYQTTIELPDTEQGYTIAFQRCCRIEGIQNIAPPSNDFGATYQCEIPGTGIVGSAITNSSPVISGNDAVAVCMGSGFTFDFSAVDPNNDSLVYRFCEAYAGGGASNGDGCFTCPLPIPGAPPPYRPLPYNAGYSGAAPMGSVTVDSKTGIVTGIAPSRIGQYVLTVCISEYRAGKLINVHRKDIHLKVSDCMPLRAVLNPDYSYCDDFQVTFRNLQINPSGAVYSWDFGDGTPVENSNIPDGTIQHKYADTGTYRVKVSVSLNGQCMSEAETNARVYPGFFPGFDFNGACLFTPFQFRDTTKSRYGAPSAWRWEFGDDQSESDTSLRSSPEWLYHTLGFKTVHLVVSSDKGCIDTVSKVVEVKDVPDLTLPFKDTLLCSRDSLMLMAIGDGVFKWTPTYNMISANTANPIVYPKTTTTYKVTMTENRCVASDEIRVRVVDVVSIDAGIDTTICLTDTLTLAPQSDGLRFFWSANPQAYFNDPTARNALTVPSGNTTYHVVANIGSCVGEDEFNVRTVPYPQVLAGEDVTICYGDTTRLNGFTDGSTFRWDPVFSLDNPASLTPNAFPLNTRTYTLLGFDTLGCPKPGIDRVIVNVWPEIKAFAGNDTAVVKGQPLQLNGSGSDFYSWSPETGLNSTSRPDPIAVLDRNMTYVLKTYNAEGCFDLDTVQVKVFLTAPDVFVPNAFIPGGRNNELKPVAVGMSSLDFFRVFNRWGQVVFQTTQLNKGWDGRVNGVVQNQGTYVWMISGTDYTGRKVSKKGTAILIR